MSHTMSDPLSPTLTRRPAGYAVVSALALTAFLVATTGCGGDGIDRLVTHKAGGQVLWEGKPLANAMVVLHPQDPALAPARANTDANGNFTLTTYDTGDGATAGDFSVTVALYQPVKVDGALQPGPNVMPPKYSNPTSTELRVSIQEGENQLAPLTLKR